MLSTEPFGAQYNSICVDSSELFHPVPFIVSILSGYPANHESCLPFLARP